MTCYFCGDETESYKEKDRPLTKKGKLHWKRIPVCEKERCQKRLERKLSGGKNGI